MNSQDQQSQMVFEYAPPFDELTVDRKTIAWGLGYRSGLLPPNAESVIDEVLAAAPQYCSIRCGFRVIPPGDVTISETAVSCNTIRFETQSVVGTRLRKSIALAVFVATAGPHIEGWSKDLFARGEDLRAFIVDTVGSEIAEQSSDWLERRLAEQVALMGWKVTNRYSPGYCEWSVAEQHKLFALLPEGFCGIRLTGSALMVPLKSVSGIIGLGPEVEREEYQCSICDMKDCFRRKEAPPVQP